MAFFNTPGIARLYSGVTNKTPFDFCSFSRNATQSAGGVASRSWLKNEISFSVVTSSFSDAGASLASALAILSVKLSLRRLPAMTTTLWGVAMGCPLVAGRRVGLADNLAASGNDASAWKCICGGIKEILIRRAALRL